MNLVYPSIVSNDNAALIGGSNTNEIPNDGAWHYFDVTSHIPAGAVGIFRGRITGGTGWLCIAPSDDTSGKWKSVIENAGGCGGDVMCRTGADGKLAVWYQGSGGSAARILLDAYATD